MAYLYQTGVIATFHRLRELYPGRPSKIIVDNNSHINSFEYWIDDDYILNITSTESGFFAEKVLFKGG